jgi:hypothetical protein
MGLALKRAGYQRLGDKAQVRVAGRLLTLWATTKDLGPKQLQALLVAERVSRAAAEAKSSRFRNKMGG